MERINEFCKDWIILSASIAYIWPKNFIDKCKDIKFISVVSKCNISGYKLGNHACEYSMSKRKKAYDESKIDFKTYVQNKSDQSAKVVIKENKKEVVPLNEDEDKENRDIDLSRKVIKWKLKVKASGALSGLNNILNQPSVNNTKINDFPMIKEKPELQDKKNKLIDEQQISTHKRTFVCGKKKHQLEREEQAKEAKARKKRRGFEDENDGDGVRIDESIKNMSTIKSESTNKISVSVLPQKIDRRKRNQGEEYTDEIEEHYSQNSDSSVFELNSQDIDKTLLERKREQKWKAKKFNEKIDANYDYNWEVVEVKEQKIEESEEDSDDDNLKLNLTEKNNQNENMTDEALAKLAMRDIMAEVTIAEKYEEQQKQIREEERKKSAKELFKSRKPKTQKEEESDEQYEDQKEEKLYDSDHSSDIQLVEEKDIKLLKKEAKQFKSKKNKGSKTNNDFIEEIDVGDMDEEYDAKKDKRGEYEEKRVFKSRFKVTGKKAYQKKNKSKFLWSVKKIKN